MRVAVVHQHYWPEIAATAQLLTDLCEDLAAAGHQVQVVCGQPSYRRVEGLPERLAEREKHRGVDIIRVPSITSSGHGVPGRVAHYVSFFASATSQLALLPRVDVTLVMSTPPLLSGLTATIQKLVRATPFVYSVQDLYPDVAIDLGVLRPGVFASAITHSARALYREAAEIVTLSDSMATRLRAHGVDDARLTVVPNWSDTDDVIPEARDNEFAVAHELAGRFVVLFSGNVGRAQGLEALPAAAELLRDVPVWFAVVGDGAARPGIEQEVQRRGLDRFTFLSPQPRERLSKLLGSCDVGLVPMRRGVHGSLVPSKLFGVMAAARPVLAAVEPDSEVARIVEDARCGLVVGAEDPAQLARGVRALWNRSAKDRTTMGESARSVAISRFDRKVCTRAYERVLVRAVGRG